MDWEDNLDGVKNLLEPPSQSRKDSEDPASADKAKDDTNSSSGTDDDNDDKKEKSKSDDDDPSSSSSSESEEEVKEDEEEEEAKDSEVEEESGGSAAAEDGKDADEDQPGQGGISAAEKAKIVLEKHRVECSSAIRDRIGSSLVVYNRPATSSTPTRWICWAARKACLSCPRELWTSAMDESSLGV
jgi:hypothetical protein